MMAAVRFAPCLPHPHDYVIQASGVPFPGRNPCPFRVETLPIPFPVETLPIGNVTTANVPR